MNQTLYKVILEEIIPSQEIKEHFLHQNLPEKTVVDLILGSIASLDNKLEWIRKIHEEKPSLYTEEVIRDIEDALLILNEEKDGKIFTIEEICVRDFDHREKHHLAAPAKGRWSIEESIIASDDECWPWSFPAWWEINEWEEVSWDSREGCFEVGEYEFLYANTENDNAPRPIFFIRQFTKITDKDFRYLDPDFKSERIYRYSGGGEGRNKLSIPFCPGDIISVWGLPFENKRDVLLLCNEPGKHYALDFDRYGIERIVNLSNGKFWLQELHSFGVSAIYQMKSSMGSQIPLEQLERFKYVASQIDGCNEKGLTFAKSSMS